MDELKIRLNQIQNNTIEEIKDEHKSILKGYHHRLSNHIKDIIQEEISGISEYKLDNWIEELLIDEIKMFIANKMKGIHDTLDENAYEVGRLLEVGKESDKLLEVYEEIISRIARRDDSEVLNEIANDFSNQISRKLMYYCEPFNGISQHNIEAKIENIRYELKPRLRKIISDYIEECQQMLKIELNRNIRQVRDSINELHIEKKLTEEEFKEFSEKLEYSGYKLVEENNKLYAENLQNKKLFELEYNDKNKTLTSVDSNLGFQITKKQYSSFDKDNDKVIIINNSTILTCDTNKKYESSIALTFDGYEFYYEYKKVTSEKEIGIVIESIKERCPKYYNELLGDRLFKEITEKTAEQNKKYEDAIKETDLEEKQKDDKEEQNIKNIAEEKKVLELVKETIEQDEILESEDITISGPKKK